MKQIELITNGTVIDHIPAGKGQKIFQLLGDSDDIVVIGLNLHSNKFGKKDILKYANKTLTTHDLELIATISSEATVSVIIDKSVAEKFQPKKPEKIQGIIACPNPNCITNVECVTTSFWTTPSFRCYFCERQVRHEDICYVS